MCISLFENIMQFKDAVRVRIFISVHNTNFACQQFHQYNLF